jgi:hypothetical protein
MELLQVDGIFPFEKKSLFARSYYYSGLIALFSSSMFYKVLADDCTLTLTMNSMSGGKWMCGYQLLFLLFLLFILALIVFEALMTHCFTHARREKPTAWPNLTQLTTSHDTF